jgi:SARP family transcriptional regulator, regulator of embCAB operon
MGGTMADGDSAFELRILGPVRAVRAGREVALGGPKQRAVLALLVLEAGRVVPTGRLVGGGVAEQPAAGGGEDVAVVCVAAALSAGAGG